MCTLRAATSTCWSSSPSPARRPFAPSRWAAAPAARTPRSSRMSIRWSRQAGAANAGWFPTEGCNLDSGCQHLTAKLIPVAMAQAVCLTAGVVPGLLGRCSMISRRLSVVVALMALGTAGAACDPAPRYDSPQSPYVGVTYAEGSIVTTGDTQAISILSDRLGDNGVTLSLPAGAYPPGTRVTLRWVSDLGLTGSDVDQLDQFGSWNSRDYSDVAAQ